MLNNNKLSASFSDRSLLLQPVPTSSKIDPTLAVTNNTRLYAFDIAGKFRRTIASKKNCFYRRRGVRHISLLIQQSIQKSQNTTPTSTPRTYAPKQSTSTDPVTSFGTAVGVAKEFLLVRSKFEIRTRLRRLTKIYNKMQNLQESH